MNYRDEIPEYTRCPVCDEGIYEDFDIADGMVLRSCPQCFWSELAEHNRGTEGFWLNEAGLDFLEQMCYNREE